jgi:hypothetical protein
MHDAREHAAGGFGTFAAPVRPDNGEDNEVVETQGSSHAEEPRNIEVLYADDVSGEESAGDNGSHDQKPGQRIQVQTLAQQLVVQKQPVRPARTEPAKTSAPP